MRNYQESRTCRCSGICSRGGGEREARPPVSLKWKPRLEALDGRIVPDATPVIMTGTPTTQQPPAAQQAVTDVAAISIVDGQGNFTGLSIILEKAGSVYYVTYYDHATNTFYTGTDSSGLVLSLDATPELDALISDGAAGNLNDLVAATGAGQPQSGLPVLLTLPPVAPQPNPALALLPACQQPVPQPPDPGTWPAAQPQPLENGTWYYTFGLYRSTKTVLGDGGLIPTRSVPVFQYGGTWVFLPTPPVGGGPIIPPEIPPLQSPGPRPRRPGEIDLYVDPTGLPKDWNKVPAPPRGAVNPPPPTTMPLEGWEWDPITQRLVPKRRT